MIGFTDCVEDGAEIPEIDWDWIHWKRWGGREPYRGRGGAERSLLTHNELSLLLTTSVRRKRRTKDENSRSLSDRGQRRVTMETQEMLLLLWENRTQVRLQLLVCVCWQKEKCMWGREGWGCVSQGILLAESRKSRAKCMLISLCVSECSCTHTHRSVSDPGLRWILRKDSASCSTQTSWGKSVDFRSRSGRSWLRALPTWEADRRLFCSHSLLHPHSASV